jgi:acetyl esterase/lipase
LPRFFPWLGVLLAAWSLLAVFPAPHVFLWLLAIGATEFGHWLAPACLCVTLLLARRPNARAWCIPAGCAALLFLSPSLRAWACARDFSRAHPELATPSSPPFSFRKLWIPHTGSSPAPEKWAVNSSPHPPLELVFTRSTSRTPAPCLLILHTGGWNSGSADEFRPLSRHLSGMGYASAALEYRLAPAARWPAQRDDVVAALQHLESHAPELGIDPSRFVLLGRSAGGQIAEACAYGLNHPAIRGVIAFYAPADLIFARQFARSDDVLNSLKLLRDFLGGDPGEVPDAYRSSSAIALANPQSPPTLLLHGSRDELVWVLQSRRLHAHLQKIGAQSHFLELPWATHAFDFNPHGPGGQISTWAVEGFLRRILPTPQNREVPR